MKSKSKVVVVGGGVVGVSALYHLAKKGWSDVVLVERNGRELPINAHIVGEKINLEPDKNIKLDGPQPLKLSIVNTNI